MRVLSSSFVDALSDLDCVSTGALHDMSTSIPLPHLIFLGYWEPISTVLGMPQILMHPEWYASLLDPASGPRQPVSLAQNLQVVQLV